MKSQASNSFRRQYNRLPAAVRKLAVKQYRLWLRDPYHPSVQFKKIGVHWSARVSADYRAVGVMEGDTVIWFWIGAHDEYEQFLDRT